MSALTFEVVDGQIGAPMASSGLAAASAGLPSGAYTTLRTYHGDRVLRLGEHVERLRRSAAVTEGKTAELTEEELRRVIAATLRTAGHPESRLRVTLAPPRLFVTVEPFEPLPATLYQEGVRCVTVPVARSNPQAKDTRFLGAAQRAYADLPAGVHEGLLLAEDGRLLEGLSSNFFAVQDGRLYTEEERALHGVTRSLVLEIARGRLPLAGRALRLDELGRTSEAFLTSASRGILPAVRVDQTQVGDGRPGPVTRALSAAFDERVRREAVPVGP